MAACISQFQPRSRLLLYHQPDWLQDHWPIRKVLTYSDVDPNHPFLPLPRKSVDEHILVHWVPYERERLRKEEQVSINARDYDTGDTHEMKLKWRGNYYNLIGKWGNIVRHKGLGVGQEIRLPSCTSQFQRNCMSLEIREPAHDNWPIKKTLTLSDVDTNHIRSSPCREMSYAGVVTLYNVQCSCGTSELVRQEGGWLTLLCGLADASNPGVLH